MQYRSRCYLATAQLIYHTTAVLAVPVALLFGNRPTYLPHHCGTCSTGRAAIWQPPNLFTTPLRYLQYRSRCYLATAQLIYHTTVVLAVPVALLFGNRPTYLPHHCGTCSTGRAAIWQPPNLFTTPLRYLQYRSRCYLATAQLIYHTTAVLAVPVALLFGNRPTYLPHRCGTCSTGRAAIWQPPNLFTTPLRYLQYRSRCYLATAQLIYHTAAVLAVPVALLFGNHPTYLPHHCGTCSTGRAAIWQPPNLFTTPLRYLQYRSRCYLATAQLIYHTAAVLAVPVALLFGNRPTYLPHHCGTCSTGRAAIWQPPNLFTTPLRYLQYRSRCYLATAPYHTAAVLAVPVALLFGNRPTYLPHHCGTCSTGRAAIWQPPNLFTATFNYRLLKLGGVMRQCGLLLSRTNYQIIIFQQWSLNNYIYQFQSANLIILTPSCTNVLNPDRLLKLCNVYVICRMIAAAITVLNVLLLLKS